MVRVWVEVLPGKLQPPLLLQATGASPCPAVSSFLAFSRSWSRNSLTFSPAPPCSLVSTFEVYTEAERLYLFGQDSPEAAREWVTCIAKVSGAAEGLPLGPEAGHPWKLVAGGWGWGNSGRGPLPACLLPALPSSPCSAAVGT